MKSDNLPLWKEKSIFQKLLSVIKIIILINIIILSLLRIKDVWENAQDVVQPLLGTMCLIQALEYRKYNKKIAIFSMLVAVFIFSLYISVLVFK